MQSVTVIGAGRLGGALAIALSGTEYAIRQIVFRGADPGEDIIRQITPKPEVIRFAEVRSIASDIVLITAQDSDISTIQREIADLAANRPAAFHTSGSLSSEVLSNLKAINCPTGSIHPLVSVSDPLKGAERFAGAYFCIEGDDKALSVAEGIVTFLGGKSFSVDAKQKALYHAAAVTASGHNTALVDMSIEMLRNCGISEAESLKVLRPLVESTAANIFDQGTERALTGPFARADAETVARHIEKLVSLGDDDLLSIYLLLGKRSLEIAERRGGNAEKLNALRKLMNVAKTPREC